MDNTGGEKADLNAKASDGADPVFESVLSKIQEAENVLVALSNDPTVDEIAAAMGLSMALDGAGKHVTAIYSGKTPNVLEFLKPRDRFETGTESLQDFVIALNKDKADHLRYKIDGDFVKVYVTPYKSTISGDDIEFSRGDFNVDLVISLNVPATSELDAALKEYGRIMHDATSINITNSTGGNFGDVEWIDPNASSISEMVSKLAFALNPEIDSSAATALLTGLVAATDRFKNPATTSEAMSLAARLMGAGADQQLVVQNVQGEVTFDGAAAGVDGGDNHEDKTELEIDHDDKGEDNQVTEGEGLATQGGANPEIATEEPTIQTGGTTFGLAENNNEATNPEVDVEKQDETPTETMSEAPSVKNNEMPLTTDTVVTPESVPAGEVANESAPVVSEPMAGVAETTGTDDAVKAAMAEAISLSDSANEAAAGGQNGYQGGELADKILNNIEKESSNVGSADYGKMIDDALSEPLPGEGGIQVGVNGPNGPVVNTQDVNEADVPEGNMMAMADNSGNSTGDAGTQASAGVGASEAVMTPAPNPGMSEEEALNIIKQGQEAAEAPSVLPADGEMPKIITGTGAGFSDIPAGTGDDIMNMEANPAMAQAPSIGETEIAGVPEMGFQTGNDSGVQVEPSAMPMPGQEMAPPPVAPVPDFGTMPPTTVETPSVESTATPNLSVAQASSATVQPDMNVTVSASAVGDIGAGALPQMPQVVGADMNTTMTTGANTFQAPSVPAIDNSSSDDPGAFKIPGIHT